MKLAELQRQIQESVLTSGGGAMAVVKPPVAGTPASRLGIYQNAYTMRHAEFLRNDFPALHCYMGDDAFDGFSRQYGTSCPASHPNARWYSSGVPRSLSVTKPYSRKPELAELAALESALGDAFDAKDQDHLTIADLAKADPAQFAEMALVIHPSAQLLTFKTNAASIWSSLKVEERPPAPIALQAPQDILVWRQAFSARFRLLGAEETMAFQSARRNLPFGVLCQMIATFGDPDSAGLRAACYLRGWIESELIVALRLADAAAEK